MLISSAERAGMITLHLPEGAPCPANPAVHLTADQHLGRGGNSILAHWPEQLRWQLAFCSHQHQEKRVVWGVSCTSYTDGKHVIALQRTQLPWCLRRMLY